MRVLFYSAVKDKKLFERTGFYATDISILRSLGHNVKTTNKISDFLKIWRYDLAFIYFWTKGAAAAAIARLGGKKVAFTGGNDDIDPVYNQSKWNRFVRECFFRACAGLSHANIVVSESDLKNMTRIKPKIKNVCVMPHVIDFEAYKYDGQKKEDIFTTIVWMGTVGNVVRKGVDRLLRIYAEFLKLSGNACRLYIIGTKGPGTDYLNDISRQLGIEQMLTFTGSIEEAEKIEMLKRSKVYFQLSRFEGFGIAAIEAMAAGNLVIHSGKGALHDVLQDHGVRADDHMTDKAVAETMLQFLLLYERQMPLIQGDIDYIGRRYPYSIRYEGIKKILNSFHAVK